MHLVYQDHLVKREGMDSQVPLAYMEPLVKKVLSVKQVHKDLQAKRGEMEFQGIKVLPVKKVIRVRLVNLESKVIRGHKLWVQWLLQLTTIMVDLEIPSLQINS